jgi:hypothetical protein
MWLLPLALVAAVLVSRVAWEHQQEAALGRQALEAGDSARGVLHLRRALEAWAPLVTDPCGVVDALTALGDSASASDVALALEAWRSARSGVLTIRHATVPCADRLPGLHERIVAGMARQVGPGATDDDRIRWRTQLDTWADRAPRRLPATLASLFFLGWIASLLHWAGSGVSADGRLQGRAALLGAVRTTALLVLWLLSVSRA